MRPTVDEREIANFALTIGAVATFLLVALLIAGTGHVAGVGIALLLSWVLVAVGYELHPSTPELMADPVEDTAQACVAVGAFTTTIAIFIGSTSGGPWDVLALIAFLGGLLVAIGGSVVGIHATTGRNGGAST